MTRDADALSLLEGDNHARAKVVAVLVAANDLEDADNRGGTGSCTRSRVERRLKDPGRVTLAMVQIKRTGAADGE
jgi:hypothetical protein